MQQANAALCCSVGPGSREAGFNAGGNVGVGLPGLEATVKAPKGQSIAKTLENALQAAVHGANSVAMGSGAGGAVSPFDTGAQVIPFPMVDPYSPIKRAGRPPVAGYTAFPAPQNSMQAARNKRAVRLIVKEESEAGGHGRSYFNVRGTEKVGAPAQPESVSGFGDLAGSMPEGFGLGDLGALGMKWEGIIGQGIQTVPAIISSSRGQAYYDPASNVNPQLFGQGGTAFTEGRAGYPGSGAGADIGASAGAAVGNVGDTISGIVARHPYLVIGGGIALVLLFMNPPRRR